MVCSADLLVRTALRTIAEGLVERVHAVPEVGT